LAQLVSLLASAGAALDAANDDGLSPLHWACATGQITVVQALLQAGALPNVANPDGITPLHVAAQCGRPVVIAPLVAGGATVDAVCSSVCHPHAHATSSHTPCPPFHLQRLRSGRRARGRPAPGVCPSATSYVLSGSLFCCCEVPISHRTTPLTHSPADSVRGGRHGRPQTGWTPLHAAAAAAQLPCVQALLEARAAVNAQTKKGETPAALASDAACKAALEAVWLEG
jgi:hypothetical protein